MATQWAHRAELEASQWTHNCFVTLTYDDDHLPEHSHLRPRDLQKFFKRLRRGLDRFDPAIASARINRDGSDLTTQKPRTFLRYLASGEYGERTKRPHFHILLFNCDFTDKKKVATNLYESEALLKYWKLGAHRIGELTGASANYVAQYSLKKIEPDDLARSLNWERDAITGDRVPRHDQEGEAYIKPFIRMSLKPPIGYTWLQHYKGDLKHGYLIRNARKQKIPRGMMKQLAKLDPQLAEQAAQAAQAHTRTPHDLRAAEAIHERRNALFQARPL